MIFQNDLIIRCLRCGQKNRIHSGHISDKPICGRCGAPLDELIVRCLNCGTKNLVPEERIHDRPICGKCGAPLYQGFAVDISDDTFRNEVITFPGPVLMCCWASWCVSSRIVVPILDQLAPKYAGGVKIAKLNMDKNHIIVSQYKIKKTPAFLLFRNGKLEDTLTGITTREELEKHIKLILTNA